MIHAVVGSTAGAVGNVAAGPDMVSERDANAVALGYKADTTKVDKAKYAGHKPSMVCSNCTLFQGKPSDVAGGCPLFVGKQVAAKGWCGAYALKTV